MILFKKKIRWDLILAFGVPGIITTFVGARAVSFISDIILSQTLGIFLIFYVVFLFFRPSFKLRQNNQTAVLGGALSGFFAGIFGVGGAIRSAFLTIFNLPKEIYIATTGAVAFMVDSTRIVTYFTNNIRLDDKFLLGLLLFIPASFLGAYFAKKIINKIPQKQFRSFVALFIFFVGVKLLIFPF